MTNVVVSFYDASGSFIGGSYSGPLDFLAVNTPPGCSWIAGVHDSLRSKVVMADDGFGNAIPKVVSRKPPKPADTDLIFWDWDDDADAWVAKPTLQARRDAIRLARNMSLAESDGPAVAALESLIGDIAARLQVPVPAATRALLALRRTLRDLPQRADFDSLSASDVPRYSGPL